MVNETEKTISNFIDNATVYSKAILNGDNKKANKANKNMIQIFKIIDSQNNCDKLVEYLQKPDDGIRLSVAMNLIKKHPNQALPVLKNIRDKNNLYSLLAKIGLDMWEKEKL